jgi:hypothetical protein
MVDQNGSRLPGVLVDRNGICLRDTNVTVWLRTRRSHYKLGPRVDLGPAARRAQIRPTFIRDDERIVVR